MSVEVQPNSGVRCNELTEPRPTRAPRGWVYAAPETAELQAPSATMPWPAQLVFWTGILAIVGACFGLQIWINGLGRNSAETLLVLGSVLIEFGLLAVWNRKFPAIWMRIFAGGLKQLLR